MKNYVAYHKTSKMGASLKDCEPCRLLTNRSVTHLVGHAVWFITRDSDESPDYAIGSVFQVSDIGDANDVDFSHYASGSGHVFDPPVVISNQEWFPEFRERMGRFAFGVHEITDERVIAAFKQIAADSGYQLLSSA